MTTQPTMTPEGPRPVVPANYGQPDCQCRYCQTVRAAGGHWRLNHGAYKPADQLATNELNRVALPGDADYVGVAQRRAQHKGQVMDKQQA